MWIGERVNKGTALTQLITPSTLRSLSHPSQHKDGLSAHSCPHHLTASQSLSPCPQAMTTQQTLQDTRSESLCASRQAWRARYAHTVQHAYTVRLARGST